MLDATKVHFVSVLSFIIKPEDFPGLSREATLLAQRRGPTIHGLVEAIVLGNEEKTQLLMVSQWASRQSWSAAQWDEDIGRSLSDLVESAESFEVRSFEPVAIVRTAPGG